MTNFNLSLDVVYAHAFHSALIPFKQSPILVPIVMPLLADTKAEFKQIQFCLACQVVFYLFFDDSQEESTLSREK